LPNLIFKQQAYKIVIFSFNLSKTSVAPPVTAKAFCKGIEIRQAALERPLGAYGNKSLLSLLKVLDLKKILCLNHIQNVKILRHIFLPGVKYFYKSIVDCIVSALLASSKDVYLVK
jgi:hypothetical protein